MIGERPFSERVLNRVTAGEIRRRRRERNRLIWPIAAILVIGATWSIALFDGVIALRLLIEFATLVSATGSLEQRLAGALLGPFAPLSLIASSLLFIAALVWVRFHLSAAQDSPR